MLVQRELYTDKVCLWIDTASSATTVSNYSGSTAESNMKAGFLVTNFSIDPSVETLEISELRQQVGWANFIPGEKAYTLAFDITATLSGSSGNNIYSYDDSNTVHLDDLRMGQYVFWALAPWTDTTFDKDKAIRWGKCFITADPWNRAANEQASISFAAQGVEALQYGAIEN